MVRRRGSSDSQVPETTATWASTRTYATTITRIGGARRGPVARVWHGAAGAVVAAAGAARRTWRGLRDTLAPAGWLLVATVAGGLPLGLVAGSTAGWIVAVGAVVLLVAGTPFLLGGHDYDVEFVLDRDRAVAGREITGAVTVRQTGRRTSLPATIDVRVGDGLIEVRIPMLAPGAEHVEPLRIAARRRGVIEVGPMALVRSDPIGLLHREVTWDQRQTIYVHPVTVVLTGASAGVIRDLEGLPSSHVVSSDLNFHAIREYAPGDSRRNVHWKSTAKVGRLMVREYEETRRSRLAVLLGLASGDFTDEDEVELAVSAAASLAVQGVRQGRDTFVAASEEAPRVGRGQAVSLRTLPTVAPRPLLDATCELRPSERSTRLEDLAVLAASASPHMSVAFLVAGSRLDLTRLRAAALALPEGTAVFGVRCDVDAEPAVRSFKELTVMTVGALQDVGHLVARRVAT